MIKMMSNLLRHANFARKAKHKKFQYLVNSKLSLQPSSKIFPSPFLPLVFFIVSCLCQSLCIFFGGRNFHFLSFVLMKYLSAHSEIAQTLYTFFDKRNMQKGIESLVPSLLGNLGKFFFCLFLTKWIFSLSSTIFLRKIAFVMCIKCK